MVGRGIRHAVGRNAGRDRRVGRAAPVGWVEFRASSRQEAALHVTIRALPPRAAFEPRTHWLARMFATGVTVFTAAIVVLAVAAITVAITIN